MDELDNPDESPEEQSSERKRGPSSRAKFSIYVLGLIFIIPIICMCLAIFILVAL
ncbi:MAG: hypothetical protein WD401_03385 [Thermomicrobiaceae bacterium]